MTSGVPSRRSESRLLDSAVREALGLPETSGNGRDAARKAESGYKRLRSVVVAENPGSSSEANGRPHPSKPRLGMGASVLPGVAVALKAAAAAAEDVNNSSKRAKAKAFGTVWDRLGRNRSNEALGVKENDPNELNDMDVGGGDAEITWEDNKVNNNLEEGRRRKKPRWRNASDRLGKGVRGVEHPYALGPEAGGEDDVHEMRLGEATWRNPIANRMQELEEDVLDGGFDNAVTLDGDDFVNYGTLGDLDGTSEKPFDLQYILAGREAHGVSHGLPQGLISTPSGPTNPLHRMQNIHINSNIRYLQSRDTDPAWNARDLYYQPSSDGGPLDRSTGLGPSGADANDVIEMKKRLRQVQLEMIKLRAKQVEVSKEVQKVGSVPGSGVKLRSQEEIDAHSVCVTNIHFAATKETIATHFGNCGDIVRVTVLADNATGKPKGCAFVEFERKESVEKALNLNESSLLSRALKISRKDGTMDTKPPASGGYPTHVPPFVAARPSGKFIRATPVSLRRPSSFPRPIPGTVHLQWKRDSPSGGQSMSPSSFGHPNFRSIPPSRVTALRKPAPLSMRDRYGLGPIRMNRSMSYVRPVPYANPRSSTGN